MIHALALLRQPVDGDRTRELVLPAHLSTPRHHRRRRLVLTLAFAKHCTQVDPRRGPAISCRFSGGSRRGGAGTRCATAVLIALVALVIIACRVFLRCREIWRVLLRGRRIFLRGRRVLVLRGRIEDGVLRDVAKALTHRGSTQPQRPIVIVRKAGSDRSLTREAHRGAPRSGAGSTESRWDWQAEKSCTPGGSCVCVPL